MKIEKLQQLPGKNEAIERLRILDGRIEELRSPIDRMESEIDASLNLENVKAVMKVSSALKTEQLELEKQRVSLNFFFTHDLFSMSWKEWIDKGLPDVAVVYERASGSSNLHAGYSPRTVKRWEQFATEVENHISEFQLSAPGRRGCNDFDDRELQPYRRLGRSDVRHRFDIILEAFTNYEPFRDFRVRRSHHNDRYTPDVCMAVRRDPDVCMTHKDGTVFLVVECKRPSYFRSSSDESPKDLLAATTQGLQKAIRRVVKYMVKREGGYAILTSEDVTYFFKKEADCLFISDGVTRNSGHIPLLGAIHYILMVSKCKRNSRPIEYAPGGYVLETEDIMRAMRRSKRKRNKQSESDDVVAVDGLEEVNQLDLNIQRSVYAKGSSGNLVMGRIRGQKVIVKFATAFSEIGIILVHEATVYEKLEPLWGHYVPHLVQYGSTCHGKVWFLATEYVDGPTFEEAIITKEVADEAVAALRAIHSSGVLHGDIHAGNIMIVDGHVRFIDFGLAEYPCYDSRLQNDELDALIVDNRITSWMYSGTS